MFINGVFFLVTPSRRIRLFTAEHFPCCMGTVLATSLKKTTKVYARHGFVVKVILMDQEFDKIETKVGLAEVNTTASREHVPKIKRVIRTSTEGYRSTVSKMHREGISIWPKHNYQFGVLLRILAACGPSGQRNQQNTFATRFFWEELRNTTYISKKNVARTYMDTWMQTGIPLTPCKVARSIPWRLHWINRKHAGHSEST